MYGTHIEVFEKQHQSLNPTQCLLNPEGRDRFTGCADSKQDFTHITGIAATCQQHPILLSV